jgi:hypothetical protein
MTDLRLMSIDQILSDSGGPELPSPRLLGNPVSVSFAKNLVDTAGNPAHAATFIRTRIIFLDDDLRGNRSECRRILIHELFHFAWVRLGNSRRLRWESLLREEWCARARGEAGWSAEWRKKLLRGSDVTSRSRAWREYCCESFCDTAAWYYAEAGHSPEMTLAPGRAAKRKAWFGREFATACVAI